MISVFVLSLTPPGDPPAAPAGAVRTLSGLVTAVIEGLVRDVALLAVPPDPALAKVADHAGCASVEAADLTAALDGGVRQARCPLVLIVKAGAIIDRAVLDELTGLLPGLSSDGGGPSYILRATDDRLAGRLFPALGPPVAVLAMRAAVAGTAASSFRQLIRTLHPSRTFKTRVSVSL